MRTLNNFSFLQKNEHYGIFRENYSYSDDLVPHLEYSLFYLIKNGEEFGPFFNVAETEKFYEFQTIGHNYIQFNKKNLSWSTVDKKSSVTEKELDRIEREDFINGSMRLYDFFHYKIFTS